MQPKNKVCWPRRKLVNFSSNTDSPAVVGIGRKASYLTAGAYLNRERGLFSKKQNGLKQTCGQPCNFIKFYCLGGTLIDRADG
jgi:hypothetical protein